MTNQFYGYHQRRQHWNWAREVLQISDAMMFETVRLIIDKGHQGASQRHDGDGGRGLKSWNQANQVTDQDEESEGHQERSKLLAVMPNNFPALSLDEAMGALKNVLQSAGPFHRKP